MKAATSPVPPTKPYKQFKYRFYFWLMDAATVAILAGLATLVWPLPGDIDGYSPLWVQIVMWPLAFMAGVVPVFLITASFMRDDYADGIWRRTMMVIGVLAAVVPLVLNTAYRITATLYTPDGGIIHRAYYQFYYFIEQDLNARAGMVGAWLAFIMAFVIVFQILRWKDSR
ncbi:hypothetical protein [Qipengyuania psychrotolerans]|uniref:Uncharacterized protein n=1 Tax=Qipengyuania psychrotolerans TaxID=2867238 RepID=A0ABX8ZH34_9SPHN|nr:hypothetical protein [Qipengyuania psychrotolerans]QZD88320.1 hypothetical protein K3166_06560 [Qipengyuania psychrotolerans]